jgi:DinB superfamily
MSEIEDAGQRLEAAKAGLEALRERVEAGSPWPLSPTFGAEPEATWGPPELLAHVAEMLGYWRAEMARVIAGGPEPVPFGRVATDERRIGAIERDRTLEIGVLYQRIDDEVARWQSRLESLSEADRSRLGVHPTLGEIPAEKIVSRFAVGHLEEHRQQLQEILEERRAPGQ